jgi:hypothetical protein
MPQAMTAKVLKIIVGDQEVIIDRKDLKGIDLFNLRITANGYAAIGEKLLHRIIMNPPANMQIDHVNHDTLDNRRCNLRVCTNSENLMNRGKTKSNTSGFKGVNREKRLKRKKYRARITANKKTFYLGNFDDPAQAGEAYQEAAREYHGEFMPKEMKPRKRRKKQ